MPSIIREEPISKKRKRVTVEEKPSSDGAPLAKAHKSVAKQAAAQVAELEAAISESQKNLNNIATLLSLAKKDVKLGHAHSASVIALCRVFCRLLVDGRLTRSNANSEKELTVIEWLRARYADYQRLVLDQLRDGEPAAQLLALTCCMQLLREEVSNATTGVESIWKSGLFLKVAASVLGSAEDSELSQEFTKSYVQPYDDVRHYTFMAIS